jgi:Nascent polypeptide associated complex NAC
MFGKMNPRMMRQMMKQMGIKMEQLQNVEEVTITTKDKRYVLKDPEVTVINAPGQKSYQVVGEAIVEEKATEGIKIKDIELVAQQANVSKEKAKEALTKSSGDLAEAILSLQQSV